MTLLLTHGASCRAALPDKHPLYLALEVGNVLGARAIFRHSDAVDCFHEFSEIKAKPFLLQIIKSKDPEILNEALAEWTKLLVDKDN